jgi:HEAT repeat protein
MKTAAIVATLALVAPQFAGGQVASRVAGVGTGTAVIEFATKDDVEICDQGIRMGEHHMRWRTRNGNERPTNCRYGSAEMELEVRNGRVTDVDIVRRDRDRTRDAVDLGSISGQEAADYLLGLVYEGASANGAEEAIFPALIADADEVWRDLVPIAQDRDVAEDVRKQSLFWLGQEAAEAATDGLADVALDEDEDQDIRDSAIFALSQRPREEGVPVLMELARTGREADTRRTAMFWLAQSGDERVVDFFEEILLGRGR